MLEQGAGVQAARLLSLRLRLLEGGRALGAEGRVWLGGGREQVPGVSHVILALA